jgi:L-Ala-D/L-Glu epimerase
MKLAWQRITAHTHYAWKIARSGSSTQGKDVPRLVAALEHEGIVGYGEAAPTSYYGQGLDTVERTLAAAEMLLGDNPRDIDGIVDRLLAEFDDQRAAVSAIDSALYDWWGKAEGQPVWRLLGLDPGQSPPTSLSIGIDDLKFLPERVQAARDFKVLKLKVGTPHDEQILEIVRGQAPDQTVRVDANCGWTAADAAAKAEALSRFQLEFIEQPLPSGELDAVRALRDASPVPIVADEDSVRPSDVPRLAGVYDGINIKLSKCGGIREAQRMVMLAREHGLKVMLGCMVETSLGIAAAAQLASLVDYVDLDGHLLLADDPFTGLTLRDGVLFPGDAPGLGVEPTAAADLEFDFD